ncbi:MAG TPA: hypothetical protein PLG75_07840 [Methanoculleus sp.]|nr:hypothetical protein [Methanoculleus sp.]
MRRDLVRRLERLEADANPMVSTWAGLMVAVDEGREIVLSPAMAGLFDTAEGSP